MSGAAFEGLRSAVPQGKVETYGPGVPPVYPADLVDALVSAFCETDFIIAGDVEREMCFHTSTILYPIAAASSSCSPWESLNELVEGIPGRMARFCGFKAQEFLDALVFRLSESGEEGHLSYSTRLLSPVLNALYERGHNGLVLDLSAFSVPQLYAALELRGSEDRPLAVTLLLPESGESVIGSRCADADITVLGHPTSIGYGPVRCALRFPLMKEARIHGDQGESITTRDWFRIWGPALPLTLTAVYGDRVKETSLDVGYFSAPNTILIPDGAGSWKEVLP